MSQPKTKILIDCDPGHDDAVAILYATRHLDLVGVTTTHGNSTIENVTRNALAVLKLGGIDVPVARGCTAPITIANSIAPSMHGSTGLDGMELPAPDRTPIDTHAVDFMIDQARTNKHELVLAVIGPATNVAMAIGKEPAFASWLREITVMGGTAGIGNVTPVAEFNVWSDPEAASVLFGCGAPIRMVGYDVTSRTGTSADDIARLHGGGRVARSIAPALDFYLARQGEVAGLTIAPMHDVCAIVPYVDDSLIEYRDCRIAVELSGSLTRGMTVCDLRTLTETGRRLRAARPPNARLAVAADARRLIDAVLETLVSYD
jgi:inosine-uridine nucleoside N-ribohydrolase